MDFTHGARVYKGVIHLQLFAIPGRQFDEFLALCNGFGHGFFKPDMLAGLKHFLGQLEVGRDRRSDGNDIDAVVADNVLGLTV